MSEALRLADELMTGYPLAPDAIAGAMELLRLAGVEAELQQAREERTALLVNEQNLWEELAQLNEMNDQLREQNTAVDAACAKYEQELAALRAPLAEPVAWIWVHKSAPKDACPVVSTSKSDTDAWVGQYQAGFALAVPLYAIKDTK
jgi:DNA repair exonuclease SbcCD ATPase subunit